MIESEQCCARHAEIIKYLRNECGPACGHIHVLPAYHLSLLAHDSHHGSYGRGVADKRIDCRHFCANVIDTWNQVSQRSASQAASSLHKPWGSLSSRKLHCDARLVSMLP